MNRNRHLTFRCTQAEYNLVKQHCGTNMSEYIISRLFKGMAEMDFNARQALLNSGDISPGDDIIYMSPEERLALSDEISKHRTDVLKKLFEDYINRAKP